MERVNQKLLAADIAKATAAGFFRYREIDGDLLFEYSMDAGETWVISSFGPAITPAQAAKVLDAIHPVEEKK